MPSWIKVSDNLIFDEINWLVRGDYVLNFSEKELIRLGCTPAKARKIANAMAADSNRQRYSLQKYRRLLRSDGVDVDSILIGGADPYLRQGCKRKRIIR